MSDRAFGLVTLATIGFGVGAFFGFSWPYALMFVCGLVVLLAALFGGEE